MYPLRSQRPRQFFRLVRVYHVTLSHGVCRSVFVKPQAEAHGVCSTLMCVSTMMCMCVLVRLCVNVLLVAEEVDASFS